MKIKKKQLLQYGHVISNKKGVVQRFVEKPNYQYPINIGNYLFSKDLIKKYKKTGHELENDFLPIIVRKKHLISHEHKGYFYSINDKKELLIAQTKLKKK